MLSRTQVYGFGVWWEMVFIDLKPKKITTAFTGYGSEYVQDWEGIGISAYDFSSPALLSKTSNCPLGNIYFSDFMEIDLVTVGGWLVKPLPEDEVR